MKGVVVGLGYEKWYANISRWDVTQPEASYHRMVRNDSYIYDCLFSDILKLIFNFFSRLIFQISV